MKLVNCILKVGASLVVTALSSSALADAPDYVRVRNIGYAGSGCPAGSVSENISPDKQAFTLLFDDFIAEVGPGISAAKKRRNCAINVDLEFPNGWQYSLMTVDYRGYISIEPGVEGLQTSAYHFQGGSTGRLSTRFLGPQDRNYEIRDTLGLSTVVWSPCGATRSLTINSEVRLNQLQRNRSGVMTIDTIDGVVKHVYGIRWQRCRH